MAEEGVMVMVSVDVAARPPVVMLVIWYRVFVLTVAVLGSSLLGWIGYEKGELNTNKECILESCNVYSYVK